MADRDLLEINQLINQYFQGLYHANVALLKQAFHPRAHLQSINLRLTRDEWLQRVATRTVPSEIQEKFSYRILTVEKLGEQAMVKVSCPLLGRSYLDFLSLLKEQGRWCIVNKMYADAPESDLLASNSLVSSSLVSNSLVSSALETDSPDL